MEPAPQTSCVQFRTGVVVHFCGCFARCCGRRIRGIARGRRMVLDGSRSIAGSFRNLDDEDFPLDGVSAGNATHRGEKIIPPKYLYQNVRRIACVFYNRKQVLHRISNAALAMRITLFSVHHRSRLRKCRKRSRDDGPVWNRHCSIPYHRWICIDILSFPIANLGRQTCSDHHCADGDNDNASGARVAFTVANDYFGEPPPLIKKHISQQRVRKVKLLAKDLTFVG